MTKSVKPKQRDLPEPRPAPFEPAPLPVPESPDGEARETRHVEFYRASFVGPVPHPAIIRAYEEVHPGVAARIFGAWEAQASHRREMERKVIDADIRAEWRGLHLAFALALVAVLGGFALLFMDKEVYGIAAILTPLVALTGVFFYSKHRQSADMAAGAARSSDDASREEE